MRLRTKYAALALAVMWGSSNSAKGPVERTSFGLSPSVWGVSVPVPFKGLLADRDDTRDDWVTPLLKSTGSFGVACGRCSLMILVTAAR